MGCRRTFLLRFLEKQTDAGFSSQVDENAVKNAPGIELTWDSKPRLRRAGGAGEAFVRRFSKQKEGTERGGLVLPDDFSRRLPPEHKYEIMPVSSCPSGDISSTCGKIQSMLHTAMENLFTTSAFRHSGISHQALGRCLPLVPIPIKNKYLFNARPPNIWHKTNITASSFVSWPLQNFLSS